MEQEHSSGIRYHRIIYHVALYLLWDKPPELFSFHCYLAAPQSTFSHYQGHSLSHSMLITAFAHIQPKGHQKPHNEVGSLSLAECLLMFEPGTFQFCLQCLNPLGRSPLLTYFFRLIDCHHHIHLNLCFPELFVLEKHSPVFRSLLTFLYFRSFLITSFYALHSLYMTRPNLSESSYKQVNLPSSS